MPKLVRCVKYKYFLSIASVSHTDAPYILDIFLSSNPLYKLSFSALIIRIYRRLILPKSIKTF